MMKRTLLRALLMTALLATATAHAAEDNALVVHLKGGATTAVLLDKLPRATFTATTLHIVGEELELSYPRSEVQRFTYEYVDPAGIATPYDSPAVRFTVFSAADVDSITYSRYDAQGQLHDSWQMQLVHTRGSVAAIPLEALVYQLPAWFILLLFY